MVMAGAMPMATFRVLAKGDLDGDAALASVWATAAAVADAAPATALRPEGPSWATERRCRDCPIPAVSLPAAALLLCCLQDPIAWLAPDASRSPSACSVVAVRGSRAIQAARWGGRDARPITKARLWVFAARRAERGCLAPPAVTTLALPFPSANGKAGGVKIDTPRRRADGLPDRSDPTVVAGAAAGRALQQRAFVCRIGAGRLPSKRYWVSRGWSTRQAVRLVRGRNARQSCNCQGRSKLGHSRRSKTRPLEGWGPQG
jgi:hypothetical protein